MGYRMGIGRWPSRNEKREKKRKGAPTALRRGNRSIRAKRIIIINTTTMTSSFFDLFYYTPIHMTLTTISIPLPSPPSYL